MRYYDMNKAVAGKQTDFINMQIRKFTIPLTEFIAKKTDILPNHISMIGLMFMILSLMFLMAGGYYYMLLGSVFVFLVCIADHCDGKLARALSHHTIIGEWTDTMLGIIYLPLVLVAVGIGIQQYILGLFAALIVAIHFMICYIWKADFSKKVKNPHLVKKKNKLRYLYGGHIIFQALPILCMLNVPHLLPWFFTIVGFFVILFMLIMQFITIEVREWV